MSMTPFFIRKPLTNLHRLLYRIMYLMSIGF
nr:MAG TPA: hypothetical protein [Bacteriophage sp.]